MRKSYPAPLKAGNLVTSASQHGDYELCNRRWWFDKRLKLPSVQRDFTTFGTVLHGCLERWMAGDKVGRVPSPVPDALEGQQPGAAVELFPKGWETLVEKGETKSVSPKEQALIRRLVKEAIERGIVQRLPGLRTEAAIQLPVVDGVELIGFLDVQVPEGVDDHKSFGKSSGQYLKRDGPKDPDTGQPILVEAPWQEGDGTSPNCVGHDEKMLIYAKAHLEQRGDGQPVRLRHNQFPKDPADKKGPRSVEAWVSPERIEHRWREVQENSRGMLELWKQTDESKWAQIPGPLESRKKDPGACGAFGGCPFRLICAKQESPAMYRQRLNKHLGIAPAPPAGVDSGEGASTVSIFKKYEQRRAQAAAGGETTTQTAPPSPVNGGTTAPPSAPPSSAPPAADPYAGVPVAPWANPECKACKGTGQNIGKGRPCMPCETLAQKDGRPTPAQFDVKADERGWLQWTPKAAASSPTPASPAPAPAAAPVAKKRTLPSKAAAAAAPASAPPAPPPTPDVAPEATPEVAKEPKADGRGRPKNGIMLRLGCALLKQPASRKVATIQDVLAEIGPVLAAKFNATSYYDLDPFKRREAFVRAAEDIAAGLGTAVIVGSVDGPDTRALYEALITVSNDVVEGAGAR